jgi:hypothetical protein
MDLVKEYLADHLRVELNLSQEYGPVETVTVKILVDGDVIDEDTVTLPGGIE